jgi:hypothetical protein
VAIKAAALTTADNSLILADILWHLANLVPVNPSAEELPSVATHGEASRATGKYSKPRRGLIIPGAPKCDDGEI